MAALSIGVCIVTTATHWPVLSAQALSFDDQQYLTGNALVRNPGWESAERFLTEVLTPSTIGGYYQPLNMISLMLDCALGGGPDNLRPFHRTSLVLHVLNTALVILLLYSLFGRPGVAALVGLLFAVHPLTVEPLAWVGERKTVLATFFALGSLVAYVRHTRHPGWKWLVTSLLLYVLAMLSKPTVAPLPVLLLLLDYWPLRRPLRRTIVEKVPFFAALALFGTITVISQARTASVIAPGQAGSFRSAAVLCYAVPFYLKKLLWPVNLTCAYPAPQPMSFANPVIAGSAAVIVALFAAAITALRWTRALLGGWLVYLVALFPTLGLIQFTWMIASDKYVYFPLLGLLLVGAWALCAAWDRAGPRAGTRRMIVVAVALGAAALEARGVRRQIAYWQDSLALARHLLEVAPNEAASHTQMGDALGRLGRRAEAIVHFREVLRLQPGNSEAQYNLGMALRLQGALDEAVEYLRQSVQRDRKNADAFNNLGLARQAQGASAEAMECFQQALAINPHLLSARLALGQSLRTEGRLSEAAEEFAECLRVAPDDASAHAALGLVLYSQGRVDEAASHLGRALQLDPNHIDAHADLGRLLAQRGRLEEAIGHLRQAATLAPQRAEAHYNLAVALRLNGNQDEALEQYEEAARLKPDYAEAHNALGSLLAASGRPADALLHFREAMRAKPDWVPPLNGAAWLMATQADDHIRDGTQAMALAERAVELAGLEDPAVLDTLAAAYAAAGQFDRAVSIAERAMVAATARPSPELVAEIGRRLELYKQAKPYREPEASLP